MLGTAASAAVICMACELWIVKAKDMTVILGSLQSDPLTESTARAVQAYSGLWMPHAAAVAPERQGSLSPAYEACTAVTCHVDIVMQPAGS